MRSTNKRLIVFVMASLPILAVAGMKNPTETPFYKRSTGQDEDYQQREAERQRVEAIQTYIRVVEGLSSKVENSDRTNLADIAKDWSSNAARAKIKYGKPGYYTGTLDQVAMIGEDVVMVMKSPDGKGIPVHPFYLQGVWKRKELVDTISILDYAARFDKGQDFDMLCAEAFPKELRGCLLFSASDFE